jgi:anti-anti-sigma factor
MKELQIQDTAGIRVVHLREGLNQTDWLGMRQYFHAKVFGPEVQHVVLDLDSLASLPSLAFGVFVSLAREAQRAGKAFHLIHVAEKVRDIMQRTHIDRLVPIRNSLAECRS